MISLLNYTPILNSVYLIHLNLVISSILYWTGPLTLISDYQHFGYRKLSFWFTNTADTVNLSKLSFYLIYGTVGAAIKFDETTMLTLYE